MHYFKSLRIAIGALIVFLLCAQAINAQTVARGPYLQLGTPTSIVIRWRTDQATDSAVYYGSDPSTLTSSVTSINQTTEHVVTLTGLQPDTRYYYAVGTTSVSLQGGDGSHTFVTSPSPGSPKSTRIWAIGDSGTANASAAAVRNAYQAYTGSQGTDLWLMLGDNAYPDGTDDQFQNAVFDMYPDLLRQVVVWPTLGNHDGHTADSATQSGAYYNIFTLPTNAEAGGVASGTEAYYSFDYGNIHFICLESYETDRSPSGAMMTWLENDLAVTDKDWIIAFWHHPPYTKGSHDSDTESRLVQMRQNALPILEAYGVDVVLSGHSHSYERSFLLDGHYGTSDTLTTAMVLDNGGGREDGSGAYAKSAGLTSHDGAVYAVAGSSGKISGGSLNHPAMFISLNSLGSMVLDVTGNRLDATFIDASGAVQDYFTIVKGPDTVPPDVISTEATNNTIVSVTFSEQVDPVGAETSANYAIDNGVNITQAALEPNGRAVLLTTSTLTEGIPYTLTVNNVQDLTGNTIATDTQSQFSFVTVVTKSFQDGVAPTSSYAGTRDVYIPQNAPDTNFGNDTILLIDGDDPSGTGQDLSTLIAWELSDIPANAMVESATMTINVTNPSGGIYNIYQMLRAWQETEATWNVYASSSFWDIPGALGPGDRGTTVLGQIGASATGSHTVTLNADGIALLQGWVEGTTPNHGIIFAHAATTDGLDFTSCDAGTLNSRPKLTVTYSLPPTGGDVTPPTIPQNLNVLTVSTSSVSLGWNPATDNVEVVGYKIYRDDQMIDTTTSSSYEDTGLTPSTSYTYVVTAFDAANNESGASNEVVGTTDPLSSPTVHVADVTVQLKTAGKRRIYATAQVTIHDGNAQPTENASVSGMWTGLVNETVSGLTTTNGIVTFNSPKLSSSSSGQFVFTVTDVVASGYTYDPDTNIETNDCMDTSGASCASGPGGPPTPTGLTSSSNTSQIMLDWDDSPAPDVNTYNVYRSINSGSGYTIMTNVSSSSHADTSAVSGVMYYYVVTAVDNSTTESGLSSEVSAMVSSTPTLVMTVDGVSVQVIPDRKHWRGQADVVVLDQDRNPVPDAQVTGEWTYEPTSGSAQALGATTDTTDPSGTVSLVSPKHRASSGDTFRLTITDVTRSDATYDAGTSVISGSNVVP